MNHRLKGFLMVTFSVSACLYGGKLDRSEKILNDVFKDKTITAKMDLPLIRSVYVTPEGQIDQQRYKKRLKKQPPSILMGQTATLTKIKVEDDVVHILINHGGVPGFAMGRGSGMLSSRTKAGSRIEIEFGHKLKPEDLSVEAVLKAVSKVIKIEGFEAPGVATRPGELFSNSETPVSPRATSNVQPRVPSSTQNPQCTLLSAEVDPLQLRPGENISLISTIEVSGLTRGSSMKVELSRQLYFDGNPLFSRPLTSQGNYSNGRHSSTFEMKLPPSAKEGVYTYITQIEKPGRSEKKETLFVVK